MITFFPGSQGFIYSYDMKEFIKESCTTTALKMRHSSPDSHHAVTSGNFFNQCSIYF